MLALLPALVAVDNEHILGLAPQRSYGVPQRCSAKSYARGNDRTEVENKTLATLEDCVARCVRSGSNICAVMSFNEQFNTQSECLLYGLLGGWPSDLNDYFSLLTHKKPAEVLFLPPGCTRDPWSCSVDDSSTLCPDPAVDGDCIDMEGRPLYAMEGCTVCMDETRRTNTG